MQLKYYIKIIKYNVRTYNLYAVWSWKEESLILVSLEQATRHHPVHFTFDFTENHEDINVWAIMRLLLTQTNTDVYLALYPLKAYKEQRLKHFSTLSGFCHISGFRTKWLDVHQKLVRAVSAWAATLGKTSLIVPKTRLYWGVKTHQNEYEEVVKCHLYRWKS